MTEQKRLTAAGPRWLKDHALEIIGRREMSDPAQRIALNPKTHAEAIRMPYLFPNDEKAEKFTAPRFDLYTGELWIPSWLSLRGKREGQKWSRYKSVESAMRGCIHILANYTPASELVHSTIQLIEYIDDLERRFKKGEITGANLQDTIDESCEVLDKAKFLKGRKPSKKDVSGKVFDSLGPDSLGRFPNRLISRTRLASAYIKVLGELLFSDKVTEKYERLFIKLTTERMLERLFLKDVIDHVQTAYPRITSRDAAAEELASIRKLCVEMFRSETVRMAPYRKPALLFSAGTFGFDPSIFNYGNYSDRENIRGLFYGMLEHDEVAIERLRHDIRLPTQALVRSDQITDKEAVMAVSNRLNKYEDGLTAALCEGNDWEDSSSCIIN